jgi:hypothetical protein
MVTVSGVGDSRMQLTLHYFSTAASLSNKVAQIEQAHAGAPFGGFFDEVLGLASACIFCCTAGIEAHINEIFADGRSHFANIPPEAWDYIWEKSERDRLLDRYQLALRIWKKPQLDPSVNPFQASARVIDLRNALIHFKPEWFSEQEEHAKLSAKLSSCFTLSPFLPKEPAFPRAWASHACTGWAVKSSIGLIVEFAERAGLNPKLPERLKKLTP